MRKPCLEEEWFVQDMAGILTEAEAREEYRLSRAIRVQHVMAGRFDAARQTGNTAHRETLAALAVLTGMGFAVLAEQKPNLFKEPANA